MTHSNRTYPNRVSKFIGSMTVEELRDYLDISVDNTDDNDDDDENENNKYLIDEVVIREDC